MLASFSIIPIGAGEELKSEIAGVIDLIDRSGINYRVGAMQTTVEGDAEEIMALIMKCHALVKSRFARVLTTITLDDRSGAANRISGKVRDVETVLGREIKREK